MLPSLGLVCEFGVLIECSGILLNFFHCSSFHLYLLHKIMSYLCNQLYQKNKRALPGDLHSCKLSSSPHFKCSVSHYPTTFSLLSLFGFNVLMSSWLRQKEPHEDIGCLQWMNANDWTTGSIFKYFSEYLHNVFKVCSIYRLVWTTNRPLGSCCQYLKLPAFIGKNFQDSCLPPKYLINNFIAICMKIKLSTCPRPHLLLTQCCVSSWLEIKNNSVFTCVLSIVWYTGWFEAIIIYLRGCLGR
jgi:hypothetical protein